MPDEAAPTWEYWKRLLQGGPLEPLQDGVVHLGYFRRSFEKKGQGARWVPIGIFPDKGSVITEVDGRRADKRPFDLLFSKSLQAISYETYMAVTRENQPWPDAPPPLEQRDSRTFDAADFKTEGVPAADRVVERTDNAPPDPLAEKKAELAEEKMLVERALKTPVTTQEQANAASEHANRVAALGKWFAGIYESENRPLLEQQKVLRVDYLHPSQEAEALAKQLTQHQAKFLLAEQKRLDAERLAEERRRVEEQQRLEAEAAETGETVAPPQAPPPAAVAPKKATSGGLTGRKTSVTTRKVAKVNDYRLLSAFLISGGQDSTPRNECRNADLKEVLDKLAHRMAQVAVPDTTQPGFMVDDEPVARR